MPRERVAQAGREGNCKGATRNDPLQKLQCECSEGTTGPQCRGSLAFRIRLVGDTTIQKRHMRCCSRKCPAQGCASMQIVSFVLFISCEELKKRRCTRPPCADHACPSSLNYVIRHAGTPDS